jgi:hypothetical protein
LPQARFVRRTSRAIVNADHINVWQIMTTFVITVNGKKIGTAGLDEPGVVTSNLTWLRAGRKKMGSAVPDHLWFRVGGLVTRTGTHVHWLERELNVGDELKIAVLENKKADKPKKNRLSKSAQLALERKYVETKAAKLGWTIRK